MRASSPERVTPHLPLRGSRVSVGDCAVRQIGPYLLPDLDDVGRHADDIGHEACLVFVAALAVDRDLAARFRACLLGQARAMVDAAITQAWDAAVEASAGSAAA